VKNIIDLIGALPKGAVIRAVAASDSMSPLIRKGDVIQICKAAFGSIRAGDIIVFSLADRRNIIAHRAMRKTPDGRGYITKGDANRQEDPWIVTQDNLLGRVTSYASTKKPSRR